MPALTQEFINNIFSIYKEIVGSKANPPSVEDIIKTLDKGDKFEYVTGSKWSSKSQFIMSQHNIEFDPGYNPPYNHKKGIETAQRLLETKIKEYHENLTQKKETEISSRMHNLISKNSNQGSSS